jgi:hypothetical protein
MTDADRIVRLLEAQNAELKAIQEQIKTLEAKVAELDRAAVAKSQPAPKFEAGPPTPGTTELAMRNLRMSAQAMAPMLDAVPDELLRQVSRDQFAKAPASVIPEREGLPPADPEPKQTNTSGWRNPKPLKSGLQT